MGVVRMCCGTCEEYNGATCLNSESVHYGEIMSRKDVCCCWDGKDLVDLDNREAADS